MSDRRRPVDRARRAALDVLTAVRSDDAYANLVLPQVLRKHGLTGRDAAHPRLAPGEMVVSKNAVHVGTGSDPVRLGEVKPFGKKQMAAADWARGVRLESGVRLGGQDATS